MASYYILVERSHVGQGRLTYLGNTKFTCDCWWDPKDAIGLGTYRQCSKTKLENKENSKGEAREGIFLPNVPGRSEIFIHYWPGPGAELGAWSDGCVVVRESDMLKMWNDITPMDGQNVTVELANPNYFRSPELLKRGDYGFGR